MLYGVTMQEPGVSKLVSVRWEGDEAPAPSDKPQQPPPRKEDTLNRLATKGGTCSLRVQYCNKRRYIANSFPHNFLTARRFDFAWRCARMLRTLRGRSVSVSASPAMRVVRETNFAGLTPAARGKVRDIYDLGDKLLIVATDRLSAFDVSPAHADSRQGPRAHAAFAVLVRSAADVIPNHVLSATEFPAPFDAYRDELAGRSMVVRKTQPLPDRMRRARLRFRLRMEGLSSHRKNLRHRAAGRACANPTACRSPFSRPRPRPPPATTKIFRFEQAASADRQRPRRTSSRGQPGNLPPRRRVRRTARNHPGRHQIRIWPPVARTNLIWIDEALTPDSSRFWPAAQYKPGGPQPSFDKQYVRDYLERIRWPKTPPGPELPPDVVAATRAKYREAFRILAGHELD